MEKHQMTEYHGSDPWEMQKMTVSLTHGKKRVSMLVRTEGEETAGYVTLVPLQARNIAADLIARANDIEGIES